MANLDLEKKLAPADVATYGNGTGGLARSDELAAGERLGAHANRDNRVPEVVVPPKPSLPLFGWHVLLPPSLRALGHQTGGPFPLVGTVHNPP